MKKLYPGTLYSKFVLFFSFLFYSAASLQAQTTITTLPNPPYNGGNSLGSPASISFVLDNTNPFPLNLTAVSNWCTTTENNSVWQLYYTATALSGAATDVTVAPWTLIATSLPTPVAASGITPINFSSLSFTIPASTQYRFALRNTGPGSTRYSGTGTAVAPNTFTGGGVVLKLGDVQIAGANVGYSGSGTELTLTPRYFTGAVTFSPALPCTEPPVAGTISSNSNPVCLNTDFTLSITGGTGGTGQTYQWQISSDNSSWSDIVGATNGTLTTSQSTTNYYRVAVTCGATTVNSASIQIITPAAVAGVFTINSAVPTGGSNFQSFNAAYNYIKCGINGSVTFNVDPASGPYNEQLIMTPVPGASAINTITFNGNGRVLQFLSTNTNERAVIKLNGADHITFDSLTINALGTTASEYGFGVQLLNNADSNTVKRCTINITNNSTSTQYAGISISASATNAIGTGVAECDNNLFEGNTINGGYYSVTNISNNTVANQRNKFIRNIIRDFYVYGFYVNGTFQTLIDGNDISRPGRPSFGTATGYAIFFTGLSTSAKVNGNLIHGLLDAAITSTNDTYGIYFTGVDALGGLDNIVSNNAIFDIKSNGLFTAIHNISSDNIFYYHNSISLDHAASTTTETTRGFYQTTTSAGIDFKNNIITLRRGGTGQMHGIYLNTATSVIASNYNDVFFTPASNVFYGFNAGANQATLANWQSTGQGANSQFIDPLFVNASTGNLLPTAPGLNDLGTPVGILVDIFGNSRSATTPDIGAWEFTVPPCTTPPVPGEATASVSAPICPGELVALGVINNSLGLGQTYQWQSSANIGGPWTDFGPVQNSPGSSVNPTVTTYYRLAVTCSGNTTFSTPVQVLVNALFPAGTYTIDKNNPTTWPGAGVGSNFNSFNAAYAALHCGIAGPVIFNVVAGSGPYDEQVIMNQIQGTSPVNTVTFNGNGQEIRFASTNTDQRAVFKLNGTDHFIFNRLTVTPLGSATSEYGFGFHLTNNADSNVIRNCIINMSTSTTSTNFAGVVLSAGLTATTTGVTLCDRNIIDSNEIAGGYYGITMVGNTTEAVGNNKITNNLVRDYYSYGIYLSGNYNTLVEKNQFIRPIRANSTTVYGIYMTSLNTVVRVSKNRIHDMFFVQPTSTSTFGGIYITGVDALGGLENIISNNAIYNIRSNGTIYGLYNSSSDNVLYYHNTINLDDEFSTSTNDTYGFYQTTTAAGIDLKNNLISVTRGGSGDKYCFFFNTATTTWTSNYNDLHKNGLNTFVGRYNAVDHATLAAWQTATTQDANSLSTPPFFTDPSIGNLEPRSPVLDNKGTPIADITTDINNLVRSATTPDIGAWEFTVPNCVAPPTAGASSANPNTGMCLGAAIELSLVGNSSGAGQTYQWQFATNIAGPYTDLGSVMQFPDTTIFASGTYYYRVLVTCSNQTATSTPVLVTMNPPFPGGVYTINNTTPTTWPGAGVGSNFNSFVEAVAVMECGIAGAVTFNVAPGTYTEQVRMHRITGASNNSRVTFQSANGDPASVILTYASTAAATNYTLMLDSASYITYRNMTINATNATNGRAVSIFNTASSDSIVNCRINAPASTTTSVNLAGIYGDDLVGDSITIKGNTVVGGTSGIFMASFSTAFPTRYNVIDSNFVSGAYQYSIYANTNQFVSISKNEVTITAPRNSTAYGIYLTNCDSAFHVNDNNVNINGITTTNYGIYLTGLAASNADRGSVSRNKVIGLTGNTGTLYGMYQTGSQGYDAFNNVINIHTTATSAYGLYSTGGAGGIKYYNNTVQNSSPATGTTNFAAYFSQTTAVTLGAVNIRNNIFTHSGSGIAMYQGNVGNIYADYNMLYTAGPTLIRQGTTNYATLQAWRDAQNWDYSSIVYEPAFTAGNDLQPDVANPNVWAMHGRGVQIDGNDADYNGNARPTTLIAGVPDMGAYEFLPAVEPPVLPSIPAAPAAGTTQVFMFGTDTVQKISWAPASTVPTTVSVKRYSGIIPPGLAPGQASMYFYTDVDATGSAPTNFTMKQFYIDPWMRDIPSEPTVKLGRTDVNNAWFVSSNSVVDFFGNSITESNLNFLDKFTGMTDGQTAVPPLPPLTTTDTSNRGRRFWVAYGHHYDFSSNAMDMVLYLSAEDSANVTVKVNGTNWVRNYAIPNNTVKVSDILPKSGLVDARITDEGLFDRGISIESDVPIVAYAHIYNGANSGAGMILPTGTYGYEYLSLNASQYYPTGGAGSYSWFMVIADRDSTLVEITPVVTSKGGRPAGVPFTVYLNRGQVYNVMGTQATGGAGTDMTGSRIKSIPNASGKCYPIAVFSGSSRTAICNTTNGDNMIQQVFPHQAWGTKYLTFATANSTSNTNYNSNIFRVMVKDPATNVRLNGTLLNPATLVSGIYYQFSTTQGTGPNGAIYVEADQPVLMAQYMVSTNGTQCPGVTASGNGDPEMIYISPIEQGIKKVVQYNTDESAITANYINIVIPTGGLPSLTIDGNSTFTDVFAHPHLAGYTCIRHNLGGAASQHIIQSDSAFTAITYGLGSVESYGYNAGTLVKNLSAVPSINNVFNTGTSNSYTCKGTPFRFNLNVTVKPTQLIWNFSQVNNLSPNVDVTQVNPVPADSTQINGKWYYRYTVNTDYIFSATGNYVIPIQLFHPSIEGCAGSFEILLPISVIAAPATDFTLVFTGCVGDQVQFTGTSVTANGVPTSQWNWNFGDNTTATIQNPTKTYTTAGTFNVNLRAIAEDGCIGDTIKPLVVNARPVVAVVRDTAYVCINASATFQVQNPVSGATYNWYSAATGGTLLGTGVTFVANNITAVTDFFVEGIVGGCASVARTKVTAAILPDLPAPVITVDSIGTNILVFRWTTVAGATGYEVSVNGGGTWSTPSSGPTGLAHTITGLPLGTTVTLLVRANGGCVPAVSQPATATTRTDQVYIPNAFTPNGDGLNDVLRVYSNVIRQMRFVVFNQWGEKIFESNDQNMTWDGTHRGKPQPSGVYMYVCDITLNTGERIQRKGAINLVR